MEQGKTHADIFIVNKFAHLSPVLSDQAPRLLSVVSFAQRRNDGKNRKMVGKVFTINHLLRSSYPEHLQFRVSVVHEKNDHFRPCFFAEKLLSTKRGVTV